MLCSALRRRKPKYSERHAPEFSTSRWFGKQTILFQLGVKRSCRPARLVVRAKRRKRSGSATRRRAGASCLQDLRGSVRAAPLRSEPARLLHFEPGTVKVDLARLELATSHEY